MYATSNHEKTTSNFEHLQSFSIHAIVIQPNLLMCSCHLSSTVLQIHTIIVWFTCYLAMSFAYILKFGNSFPFSPSLFIPTHFLANPLLGFQLSGNDCCLRCWVLCDLLGVLSFTNHAEWLCVFFPGGEPHSYSYSAVCSPWRQYRTGVKSAGDSGAGWNWHSP